VCDFHDISHLLLLLLLVLGDWSIYYNYVDGRTYVHLLSLWLYLYIHPEINLHRRPLRSRCPSIPSSHVDHTYAHTSHASDLGERRTPCQILMPGPRSLGLLSANALRAAAVVLWEVVRTARSAHTALGANSTAEPKHPWLLGMRYASLHTALHRMDPPTLLPAVPTPGSCFEKAGGWLPKAR
jgi:hypothetical protein